MLKSNLLRTLCLGLVVTGLAAMPATSVSAESSDDNCSMAVIKEVFDDEPDAPNEVEFLAVTKNVAHAWIDFGDGSPVEPIQDDTAVRISHTYWPSQERGWTDYWPVVLYELPDNKGAWHCGWDGDEALRVLVGDPQGIYIANIRK